MFTSANNLDYLATRLHARRSRMAEAERLDALCQIRTLPELSRAVRLDTDYQAATEFQRRLVQDLAGEIAGCVRHVGGAGADPDKKGFAVLIKVERAEDLEGLPLTLD